MVFVTRLTLKSVIYSLVSLLDLSINQLINRLTNQWNKFVNLHAYLLFVIWNTIENCNCN